MKPVHWLGQKESLEGSAESAPVSFRQANQTCTDCPCHGPELPSLRPASTDVSGPWALKLWRADLGRGRELAADVLKGWRVGWRPPAGVYGRNLGLPLEVKRRRQGRWSGSENSRLVCSELGAVTPRKPTVREYKRRAGKGRPSSLCPGELPADSGPPLGDFKNASSRELPTGRGGMESELIRSRCSWRTELKSEPSPRGCAIR